MKAAPTLIDELYRASFQNETVRGWTNNALWRDVLRKARRFVLDDAMSSFLGELGTQAFVNTGERSPARAAARFRMIEHLRMSARLPSEVTWVEYNLRKCQAASQALLGRAPNVLAMPEREGWLLQRHPHLDTAFIAHIISYGRDDPDMDGTTVWTIPLALAWTADMDTVLPWRSIPFDPNGAAASEISTGLGGYKSERASYVYSPLMVVPPTTQMKHIAVLLKDWAGVQRRIWALLATINDLPVEMTEVRASKGFVGRHQYRKFLDHKTVTLTVPVKLYRKTIRAALAVVHRRGGPVREHWRRDWRKPLSVLCEHDWGADENHMFCTLCKGRKIWVHEHVRGDTSRGFVSHDYRVTHEAE
jgi:hypothetical protein